MFLEFTWNAWEKRKLGDVAERVRKNDGRMNLPILTISAGKGWLTQGERFSQSIAGKELKNYTLLSKGELSYNHGNSKLAKYGAVFALKDYDEALVPRVYHSFDVSGKADSDFVEYLFASKTPDNELRKLISSGARMDGLLNINYEAFMGISILLPSVKEQRSISRIIQTASLLIAATQHKIDALEQIKEKLSQNLFDQSWRFKEYSTPWKENKLKDIVSAYSGGTPSANIRTYYGGHIPFIRSAEIHSSTTALTLTQEGLQNSSAKLVKTGDILYALYGANSGDVDRSKINGAINQAILAMRPSKENDPNFILFQLMRMKDKIVSTYLQGGQGNLSGRLILALNLDMPESTLEQRTIGRLLQLLCELIGVNQSKYSQLELLKKSLLQNLFV